MRRRRGLTPLWDWVAFGAIIGAVAGFVVALVAQLPLRDVFLCRYVATPDGAVSYQCGPWTGLIPAVLAIMAIGAVIGGLVAARRRRRRAAELERERAERKRSGRRGRR
ncbi:hypothetical protein [Naumannella cuiyingiana]|uniref:Na+/proline symporter n=1 Tax=Naumannella cuiyingiana TaxID=1347891 RepID=A0A7Z0ILH0_9ACTN|nr:hypothetical protein [Naumannella cuiyingiana]NYI71541.1 Na+/proline symporter [Naumannella cuiyingiana]